MYVACIFLGNFTNFNCVCACVCVFFSFPQGMNKVIDSELLEYSVHAGVQTTLQVWSSHT